MKSKGNSTTPDGAGAERPDIVIGDLDGASCCSPLTECVVESFRGLGYSVKACTQTFIYPCKIHTFTPSLPFFHNQVNWLYKGAFVLRHHGRPGEGKHAVQVPVSMHKSVNSFKLIKICTVNVYSQQILQDGLYSCSDRLRSTAHCTWMRGVAINILMAVFRGYKAIFPQWHQMLPVALCRGPFGDSVMLQIDKAEKVRFHLKYAILDTGTGSVVK